VKPEAVLRAERVLGLEAESWTRVVSRGWSRNEHWTIACTDGTRAFLKVASIEPSPQWVRDEVHVYECVEGPFMPRFLGWEDGEEPLLVLEDVSAGGRFPPPWEEGDVDAVLAALQEVAAVEVTGELAPLGSLAGWHDVARDPAPFLSLELVSPEWLDSALPVLLDASDRTSLEGDSLVHCDVRSDNLCLRDGHAVLFDWNHACISNAALDVAFWLPSLKLEGGPDPQEVGGDDFAVVVAGFFAAGAGLPPPEGAPLVRGFQRAQLEVALPWACTVVGLSA
jgi:Phosphotransferase enzyme family